MKWIGISGSWRKTNKQIEQDVREVVCEIISRGDGIVTGGALNVDYFATDEALKLNPACEQVKIILPTPLEVYAKHYRKRASEEVITKKQAEALITQLTAVKQARSDALVEMDNRVVNKDIYYARNKAVVEVSDKLIAFQVNDSAGTQDTIDKAKQKGIPVKVYSYTVD